MLIAALTITSCSDVDKDSEQKGVADFVVYGKIFTSDNDKIVDAFAVKDGKFVYVGTKDEVTKYASADTKVVDYTGKGLVIPGCTEGHGHFIGVEGVATMLPGFKASYEELVSTIIPQKMKSNPGPFVSFGWATEKVSKDNQTDYASVLDKNALSNGKSSLHRLMRQPFAAMDGMNEYGLCYGAFQLPNLSPAYPESEKAKNNPDDLNQNTGKKAIHSALFHNLILSRCKTVKEVETMLSQYDMVGVVPVLNVHWLIADATGDWAIFEYWKNELHVYRENDLKKPEMLGKPKVANEWFSIENYYRNPELVATYETDGWQKDYSPKTH